MTLFHLLRPRAAAFGLVALAACAGLAPVAAESFQPGQKSEIEQIIKDYLLKNPEVLRDALTELEKRQKAEEVAARAKILGDVNGPLYTSKQQAVIGNPSGKTVLVEFFDYNCGYCKRATDDLARLMKDNPDLKVILKEFPVLGPNSVEAAKVAAATRDQLGAKYWDFHQKLMATRGQIGKAQALAVARELGADVARVEKDAEGADVGNGLNETMMLADALNLSGTPVYVLADDVIIGAVGYDKLKGKIDNVKKCGKTTC
jgi:protein-disulfide isomerase